MPFEQHPTDPNKIIMRAGKYKIQKPWVGLTEFSWLPQGVISTKQQRVTHGKFLRMGVCT